MLPFETTSTTFEPVTLTEKASTPTPWSVVVASMAGWALLSGTAILLGLVFRPAVTWLKDRLFQVQWDAPFDNWSIHSLQDPRSCSETLVTTLKPVPYLSDKMRIYVLPEEDVVQLFRNISGGVDPDAALLELWNAATSFDLDELGDEFTLGEVVSSVPDIAPEALHAIVFTFSEPSGDEDTPQEEGLG